MLTILTENYKTYFSLNNLPLPDPMPNMKELVEDVLVKENYEKVRVFKLGLDDFLCLLAAFNARHIHFT